MTIFTALRSVCSMRVNDTTVHGYPPDPGKRARYCWVCAKQRLKPCVEGTCPVMKKIKE